MSDFISNVTDDGNAAYEVNHEDEELVEDRPAEDEEPVENLPAEELPVEELVKERPPAPASDGRSFMQRRIPIRYAVTANPDRGSQNLPEPKHLRIKLPEVLAQLFPGVWAAVRGEEVFIDFFARNDQDDRKGGKVGDPWRWIKIKDNGEIALGISRPYTKSISDGALIRDYKVGAFKLAVPLDNAQ